MSEDDRRRWFVAVPIGQEVREQLARWQSAVRKKLPNARWVDPNNYHITLKFYGSINPALFTPITDALTRALANVQGFSIEVVGFDAFPNLQNPRVFWAGVGRGAEQMRELAGIVEAASVGIALPADRRDYRPHLTLARFRTKVSLRDIPEEVLADRNRVWGTCLIDRVHLMQSRLSPQGARYEILHTSPLLPAAAESPQDDRRDAGQAQDTLAHRSDQAGETSRLREAGS